MKNPREMMDTPDDIKELANQIDTLLHGKELSVVMTALCLVTATVIAEGKPRRDEAAVAVYSRHVRSMIKTIRETGQALDDDKGSIH